MRHGVKKIKIKLGKDANKMLMRKLIVNFINIGRIKTTAPKAKLLKSQVEKLVEKAKIQTEANKNYLLKTVADKKLSQKIFKEIGVTLKNKVGGYVRVVKLGTRDSDGAEMAKLEWVYPVISEDKNYKKPRKEELKHGPTH